MKRVTRFMIAAAMAVAAAGCSGDDGANGQNGANGQDGASCTVVNNGDGTFTITCGDEEIIVSDGSDGTDGTGCTAVDNMDGTYTITCGDDEIIVSDGDDLDNLPLRNPRASLADGAPDTCIVCHSSGSLADVGTRHAGLLPGQGQRDLDLAITQVANNGGALAVTFTVKDALDDTPITNLTMDPVRIYVNQHEPAAETYDLNVWSEDFLYERASTVGAESRLVQSPPGTYTYTFLETIADAIANDGADATLVQQVAMRIRGLEGYNYINAIYQTTGLPTTVGEVATAVSAPVGNIVNTASCETCHGPRIGHVGHGGGYNVVEMCRNCHTRANATRVTNGTDLMTMIHQIHAAIDHTEGGTKPGEDWSHTTYPQDVNNCRKCHSGADGGNWNTMPTIEACGSCHTGVDFATHSGGQTDNSGCAGSSCHTSARIIAGHASENVTPNNPETPLGAGSAVAANFEYVLNSATAAGNDVTVNFQILKDGAAVDVLDTYPPTGFSGGPNFRFAYALPQDGIAAPADWNNLGENKAQPLSASLASLITDSDVTAGTTTDTFEFTYTYPDGATLRAVAMDGYFQQVDFFSAGNNLARHTPSAVIGVDGDTERRAILNVTGCLDCHERLELHGGNRVLAAETDDEVAAVCIVCHNPNLSSSGNTFDYDDYVANPGDYNSSSVATVGTYGTDPFAWPEATQNFKDLVHGIHASGAREYAYEHVRIRSGNAYSYDWSHVTFPGDASNCSKCHKEESYSPDEIPAGALVTTNVTGTPSTRDEALAVRDSVPNADDEVIRPVAAACYGCHNGDVVNAHMNQN